MCRYFSCVITSDFKVYWLKTNVNHEDILASIPVEDLKDQDQLGQRKFVKIEIVPRDMQKITRNKDNWQLTVDEDDIRALPEWFLENRGKAEKACWKAWEESIPVNLVTGDEEVNVSDDRFLLAVGKAKVEASDSVSIRAYGSVSIRAYGSVSIEASDSVSIEASDSVSIKAYEYWTGKYSLLSITATLVWKGKIYVHEQAEIVKVKKEA